MNFSANSKSYVREALSIYRELLRLSRLFESTLTSFLVISFRYKRLWNSIAFILAHDKVGNSRNSPLLLAKAASSENERYVPGTGGIGDKETFSKGMVDKGKQVGQGIVLDVKDALADMPETVKRVMQWMKESMP